MANYVKKGIFKPSKLQNYSDMLQIISHTFLYLQSKTVKQ